jgi:hypothetical protein
MLFDTVEFLSDQSKIVNPKIEQTLPQTAESTVTLQDVAAAVATAAATKADKTTVDSLSTAVASATTKADSALSAANTAAAIYDIGGFSQGKPDVSSSLFRLAAPRAFTLPANLAGSIAKAGTAATASTVFIIKKNGSQIGTMTFAAGGSTASFSLASQVSVAVGDIIDMVAPATQDATLSDVSVTIAATLA